MNEDYQAEPVVENEVNEEAPEIMDLVDKEAKVNIAEFEEQIKNLNDKLLRAVAESENLRKRYEKMIEEAREYAVTNFAKDMISARDNLSRALLHQPSDVSPEIAQLLQGVNMVVGEIEGIFKKNGLTAINPAQGDEFDYNLHHAISQISHDALSDNAIVNTMQQGYKIKDRLIRPAIVTVVKNS